MTPDTRRHYETSCAMLAQVNIGIQLEQYEPVHLLQQSAVHLLLMQGLRDLSAVLLEEVGETVQWTTAGGSS